MVDDLRKLLFKAFDRTEVSLRKESARRSLFRSQEPGKISEPPAERKYVDKPKGRFRGNYEHEIDEKHEKILYHQEVSLLPKA